MRVHWAGFWNYNHGSIVCVSYSFCDCDRAKCDSDRANCDCDRVYTNCTVHTGSCRSHTMSYSMTSSTRSHIWWETRKCSIFSVMPCVPSFRESGGSLVVNPAEKDSLLGSLFDSKQCHEQLVTHLTVSSAMNSLSLIGFTHSVRRRLLCDLHALIWWSPSVGSLSFIISDGFWCYCDEVVCYFRWFLMLLQRSCVLF